MPWQVSRQMPCRRKRRNMSEVKFLLTGDTSISVEFGDEIREEINHKIRAFHFTLTESPIPGVVEIVPTYRSLMIHYDPGIVLYNDLLWQLKHLLGKLDQVSIPPRHVIEIPVLYGGEEGPDLEFVAEHCNLSPVEVVQLHTSADYLIYMLGFTPGFPYLGGMDKRIAAPRLKQPRVKIPAGSVGIAGSQTGVYPIDSPGGWQLIGKTPLRLYDPNRAAPVLCQAGDYIRFRSIDRREFDSIAVQEAAGNYVCKRYSRERGA